MSILKTTENAVMQTYGRFPLSIKQGAGSYVWDHEGNTYLDFTSGIATCNLGHVPTGIKEAVQAQMEVLWHCSNLYHIPQQEAAAAALTEGTHLDQVFFCNSGAEANEAAWKLARKYTHDKGLKDKNVIVTFSQSFHGRTGGAMAATAQEKIHKGFAPLMPGFQHLPFNDPKSIYEIDGDKTAAVLLELVQGEGGVRPAEYEWVQELSEVCRQKDILFMIDEIQTGAGRTGTFYLYEQYNLKPDVVTLAKGIGSGFPAGAMLAVNKAAAAFTAGTHGSTFGGNPLAMTAVKATVETLKKPFFLSEVKEKSERFLSQLQKIESSQVKEVRGKGCLIGIEFNGPVKEIIEQLRNRGVLVLPAGENVVRILPPLTATNMEYEKFLSEFKEVISERGAV
ncbi:acetylornithine transaminase [Alkalicoccus daliensis]|uniref:Acetylornithine aminotransferase n=1 Tax=Alkalicoccus daliensis TaxID=745820 RepID=A0A1H0AJV9_9BACI|nr:acetylornithine transaminase [Alkalicoccus daliensis]SDN33862.1 acetylornithine aminotransferase apoenzyme [Alkalicoccus daliensis]